MQQPEEWVTMTSSGGQLHDLVEEIVKGRFDAIKIVRVDVEEGRDHDGDDVLFVTVVFDGDAKDMKADRMAGLARHLRSGLAKIGETRFPLTSYLSATDYEGAAA